MKKYKSVDEVLKKGNLSVNVVGMMIFVIVLILSIFLSPLILSEAYVIIGMVVGFILGIFLFWLWWSYKIVKWRIWAFEHTRKSDWNTLKQKAIIRKLIWEDGNIFEKTEIRSKAEAQKIKAINLEIEQIKRCQIEKEDLLDETPNEPQIPPKIDYFYNRRETILSGFLPIVFVAIGCYLFIVDEIVMGILSIGLAIYHTDLNRIQDVWKKDIQFSINDEGISIKKLEQSGFVNWENTEDILVDTVNGTLKLDVWENEKLYQITFNLNDYTVGDYNEFLRTINVYLKRNLNKKTT